MQVIEISNFGPVKNARIELHRLTVLIGEQASGKSTIAKLIYFFKSISEEFFSHYYQSDSEDFNNETDLIFPIRERFYDFFGSTRHLPDFSIVYTYAPERTLTLSLNEKKRLFPTFSKGFFSKSNRKLLKNLKGQILRVNEELEKNINVQRRFTLEKDRMGYVNRLSEVINTIFTNQQNDSLFVIAGRNATVGYTDFFEKQLYTEIQNNIAKAYQKRSQTIDEALMQRFIERVSRIKSLLMKHKDFEGLLEVAPKASKQSLRDALDLITLILRGKYQTSEFGERLQVENEQFVYLQNASSGQQEAIRILQDVFVALFEGNSVFRIIEETEAHLFPMAQKYVIELLALLLNSNNNNELILTTHSPYVLSVLNNLLFADRVISKNGNSQAEVNDVIPNYGHLKADDFAAYAVGDSFIKREDYCVSIVNQETGMIDQSYLDVVSELLSQDFDKLYRIHAKSFAR